MDHTTSSYADGVAGTTADRPADPGRRRWLTAGLGAAGGALIAGHGRAGAADCPPPPDPALQVYPYAGVHQAGVISTAQQEACLVAFDVIARDRAELETLFARLTERIAVLTRGGPLAAQDPRLPPADSGMLGTAVQPDGLTVTTAVGESLFDARYGLAARRPAELVRMPAFPNDALEARWCGGDLLLQLRANSRETVLHAVRDIVRHTPGLLAARWKLDGFLPASAVRHGTTPINLFGFKDGTGNPSTDNARLMDEMVWTAADGEEPAWVAGGSYMAVRLIRFNVERWDRAPLDDQQADFGREKASGAPLGRQHEFDDPDFESDPSGRRIPVDSHMRRAEPRSSGRHDAKLLRVSYSYSLGLTPAGQLDMGLAFICFQRSLANGFIATQTRLNGEPLEEYIKPFGGGYYFVLPGMRREGEMLGAAMLAA